MDTVSRVHVNGKEIILVPTAHVSQASIELVKQVVEEEQPDSVCIELDAKRYENIKNPTAWEQTDLIKVIKTKQVGFMLANFALSSYQKKMADKLGTTPGGEMLQGIKSAETCGAELVLADRDIQTTFLRIWRALSLKEKYNLFVGLFVSGDDDEEIDDKALNEMLQSDTLDGMLADMKEEFPAIGQILIHERDQYLSQMIKRAPGNKVVAVLGAAHIPGILEEINKDIDLTEISTVPAKKSIGKIVGWAIPILIVGLIVYGFVTGFQTGVEQLSAWILWNSGLAALFTALALGHPLSVLTSLVMAPFATLNPLVAVGWFSGLMQATVKKPTVKDLHDVPADIFSLKGFYRNKVLRVFMVVIFANIGGSLGNLIGGLGLLTNLFG